MKIDFQDGFYVDDSRKININKTFGSNIVINANLIILSEKFVEYQKDLFNEFFADIIDKLSVENAQRDIDLNDFQKDFENGLQTLNNKLNIFAEKIKDAERFTIKGLIQVFFGENYMASMIGDVSVMIFRNGKLSFVVNNDIQDIKKIDVFSELIEGDIENGDYILGIGLNTQDVVDDDDIEEMLNIHASEDKGIFELFEETLQTRISKQEIGFMILSKIEFEMNIRKQKVQQKFMDNIKLLGEFKNTFLKYRYPIVITIAIGFVIFLIYSLLSNFTNKNSTIITEDGVVIDANITPEELKKEVSLFIKMDPSSDAKTSKYKEIMEKIKILEKKNKWPQDVITIKNTLDKEYYKGFNIFLIDSLETNDISGVYPFDDTEKAGVGDIKKLVYSKGYIVGGSKGAILLGISDKIKGRLISYGMPFEIKGCTKNLLSDGLYCFSNDGNIFNVTKSGTKTLENTMGEFPKNIEDMGVYGKSKLYLFSSNKELNDKGTFILKYDNSVGSQTKFGKSLHYTLDTENFNKLKPDFSSGFNGLAVDGTFLMWNKKTKKINQTRRDQKTLVVYSREMNVKGGNIGEGYSSNVKVITDPNTNYVYLFDLDNQTITVLRSAPYKTNSSYISSYELTYFFRIKYNLGENRLIDVYIDGGEKPSLYFVNKLGVYKMKLYEFIDSVNLKNKK